MAEQKTIRIGGASGYWGEAAFATRQLVESGGLDYLVYDYLAEITLSIMARARAANPDMGYAPDFVTTALAPNIEQIAAQGIKVISNAGGVNPRACAAAVTKMVQDHGLALQVAVISGDDLMARAPEFAAGDVREMFSGVAFPAVDRIASINAYLGAAAIAVALRDGADIVITGRGVDSAVTLGACLAEFDWEPDDFDRLAQACVAGHLIECGPQVTGGNFTDWRDVGDGFVDIGYPIAEIQTDGVFTLTKPANTGGLVTVGSTAEQLLYEIGDPQRYLLPDVACDFTQVKIKQIDPERVQVSGAMGTPPPDQYKVSATYIDGYKAAM
ncbi:MAG: DUF1446 domain-containing protein, partial [Gammaproteobacteria bacterium]|nr:DUF1446 domain-containing protein [Gammaproteobacteria bacterium]